MATGTSKPVGSNDFRDLLANATNLDDAVNSDTKQWTDRKGRQRATMKSVEEAVPDALIARDQAQAAADASVAASSAKPYKSLAALQASTSPAPGAEAWAAVTNDPVDANNGYYTWSGSVWVKSALQPPKVSDLDKKQDRSAVVDPDFLIGFLDAKKVQTWLGARKEDGGPTDHSLKMLMPRIREQLGEEEIDTATAQTIRPAPMGRVHEILGTDVYWRDGELLPVLMDMQKWSIWGSSTAQGFHASLGVLAATCGATLYGGGQGSERLDQTLIRLGSRPALLTLPDNRIPASGTAVVTVSNVVLRSGLKPFRGIIAGVTGMFSGNVGAQFTFTREEAGAAVDVAPGTALLPIDGNAERASMTILNLGKNTLTTAAIADSAEQVIAETHRAVRFLAPLVKRFLILGHFQNTGQDINSDVYKRVAKANAELKKFYGPLFIDLGAYLCSPQVWIDTGVTPTEEDLTEQANGRKPMSLSSDSQHMNTATYAVVTEKLIKPAIYARGWYF